MNTQKHLWLLMLPCLFALYSATTTQAYKPGIYLLHYYGNNNQLLYKLILSSRPLAENELVSKVDIATIDHRNKRKDEIFKIKNDLCKTMVGARVTITSPSGEIVNNEKCPARN